MSLCRFGRAETLFSLFLSLVGLLGPSGCGKTTLLKVLLGRHTADEGSVAIFGRAPHSPGHPVPGHWVGYTPQEIALYADLSIAETLRFHASMHQMSGDDFEHRKQTLLHMLDMPDDSKIVRNLSGGQQRRVSLAAALLHAPELLILDEPTVGLDPMLRHRIWEHLRKLATTAGTTIVITTHYIEEAKAADRVGLMRHGRILVEGSPDLLLDHYQLDSLEDVFLQVCRNQSKGSRSGGVNSADQPAVAATIRPVKSRSKAAASKINSIDEEIDLTGLGSDYDKLLQKPPSLLQKQSLISRRFFQVFGVSRRQFTQILRNWRLLSWEILVPTVQICLFMLAIGASPRDLTVGSYNQLTFQILIFNFTYDFPGRCSCHKQ